MSSLEVFDLNGEVLERIELDNQVFDGQINEDLMHQAVVIYLSKQRKGLASTKTRGEVKGGGRKPWRQKGVGRARVGSIRSPLWRKGGVVFGPKPRLYRKEFPKKMRTLALKSALNAKLRDKEMMVLKDFIITTHKTKEFFRILKNLQLAGEKIRLVVDKIDENLKLASRNIEKVNLNTASTLTTYTTLDCKKLVFTKEALRKVEERIKRRLKRRDTGK